jgi:hypothetical protein
MPSVVFLYCYAESHYTECHYADCHGAYLSCLLESIRYNQMMPLKNKLPYFMFIATLHDTDVSQAGNPY